MMLMQKLLKMEKNLGKQIKVDGLLWKQNIPVFISRWGKKNEITWIKHEFNSL